MPRLLGGPPDRKLSFRGLRTSISRMDFFLDFDRFSVRFFEDRSLEEVCLILAAAFAVLLSCYLLLDRLLSRLFPPIRGCLSVPGSADSPSSSSLATSFLGLLSLLLAVSSGFLSLFLRVLAGTGVNSMPV